jgi:glycine hydroxymethyltransferase
VAFGEALQDEFKTYSAQVIANAQAMAAQLQSRGLKLVSNGTDNHLLLVDLRSISMTGKRADQLMGKSTSPPTKTPCPLTPNPPLSPAVYAWVPRP